MAAACGEMLFVTSPTPRKRVPTESFLSYRTRSRIRCIHQTGHNGAARCSLAAPKPPRPIRSQASTPRPSNSRDAGMLTNGRETAGRGNLGQSANRPAPSIGQRPDPPPVNGENHGTLMPWQFTLGPWMLAVSQPLVGSTVPVKVAVLP